MWFDGRGTSRVVLFHGSCLTHATTAALCQVSASTKYARAGRYIIRVEASDGRGGMFTLDLPVIVRKDNDTGRLAPCCR